MPSQGRQRMAKGVKGVNERVLGAVRLLKDSPELILEAKSSRKRCVHETRRAQRGEAEGGRGAGQRDFRKLPGRVAFVKGM